MFAWLVDLAEARGAGPPVLVSSSSAWPCCRSGRAFSSCSRARPGRRPLPHAADLPAVDVPAAHHRRTVPVAGGPVADDQAVAGLAGGAVRHGGVVHGRVDRQHRRRLRRRPDRHRDRRRSGAGPRRPALRARPCSTGSADRHGAGAGLPGPVAGAEALVARRGRDHEREDAASAG
ncbi:hypothetical protein ACRAWD_09525 [Caulobacter segnis]